MGVKPVFAKMQKCKFAKITVPIKTHLAICAIPGRT